MYDLLFFLISSFIFGLTRGAAICAWACAPAIIPYIISENYTWKEGFKAGMVFNLPRIFLLSIIGAAVGALSYGAKRLIFPWDVSATISGAGYMIFGIFMIGMGTYFIRRIDDKRDIEKKKTEKKKRGFAEKYLSKKMRNIMSNPNSGKNIFMFTWGALLAVACIGEVSLIEMAIIAGIAGSLGESLYGASLFGFMAMLLFALGATVPIILITTICGGLSESASKKKKLMRKIRAVGAFAMIAIGFFIIILAIHVLFFSPPPAETPPPYAGGSAGG